MNKPLLIEIGVEELPAIPFLNELPNIEKKWSNILEYLIQYQFLLPIHFHCLLLNFESRRMHLDLIQNKFSLV